jgi:hypothetical protein
VIARTLTTLGLFFSACQSIAQSPSLNYSEPSAVAPGKTTTVTFFGDNLKDPTELWTSFPAKATLTTTTNSNEAGKATFQIAVPKDTPVGIGAVRLATTNGVSSLLLFMVDDLPSAGSNGTNNTVATAQVIKWPVAIDGACDEISFNFYNFTARKGERISVDVVANRLGSPLDPVVRLLDRAAKELVYCDDDPAAGADSRFSFVAPRSAEYLIELRDIGYQGGPKYRYHLRVGNFPLAGTVFPSGARAGTQAKVLFIGEAVEGVRPTHLLVPEHQPGNRLNLSARSGAKSSGFVTFVTSESPELMEIEPNNTPETATKVILPSVLNGRFSRPRDMDFFEFAATNGQRLVFSGHTRSLGSPCDLTMRLFDTNGKQIAEADISGANEGTLTNTFKEAGSYRLAVEELNRQGGPAFVYRIEVQPFRRGFELSVETDKVQAPAAGTLELKVTAARREFDGPITLALDGLGDDFALEGNVIPEKKSETTIKAKLPDRFHPGQMVQFRAVGKAKISDIDFSDTAGTMSALRKLFPLLRYPPPSLDGLIALGVKPPGAKPDKEKPEPAE